MFTTTTTEMKLSNTERITSGITVMFWKIGIHRSENREKCPKHNFIVGAAVIQLDYSLDTFLPSLWDPTGAALSVSHYN